MTWSPAETRSMQRKKGQFIMRLKITPRNKSEPRKTVSVPKTKNNKKHRGKPLSKRGLHRKVARVLYCHVKVAFLLTVHVFSSTQEKLCIFTVQGLGGRGHIFSQREREITSHNVKEVHCSHQSLS